MSKEEKELEKKIREYKLEYALYRVVGETLATKILGYLPPDKPFKDIDREEFCFLFNKTTGKKLESLKSIRHNTYAYVEKLLGRELTAIERGTFGRRFKEYLARAEQSGGKELRRAQDVIRAYKKDIQRLKKLNK